MLIRGVVTAVVLVLAVSCGGSTAASRTIVVEGEKVPVERLTASAAGLCLARSQAATDATAARATFFNQSHDALHTVAKALEPVDRAQAAALLEAMQKVEADLTAVPPDPALAPDFGRLADVDRAGLGRLAIAVPSCEK